MDEVEQAFHETWLGMLQPSEGLVVSVPVLVEAQCMERQPVDTQRRLLEFVDTNSDGAPRIASVGQILREFLGYPVDAVATGADAERYELFIPEGRQVLHASAMLHRPGDDAPLVLIWELPTGLDLDRPETVTGDWSHPPSAKFDRLLRHVKVPVGIVTNLTSVRLIYAPTGEASGSLTFHVADMLTAGGRVILDAFLMLLSAHRLYGVAAERTLPQLLALSRRWQATVSEKLAVQVLRAATVLLDGLQGAAERDRSAALDDAFEHGGNHLYRGILTALLRLVFLLYAEDSGLMPIENATYRSAFSVFTLFEQLRADAASFPDLMGQRFGAWNRLLAIFRAIFLGSAHGDLVLPPRRGALFDPHRFPFLEGWSPAGGAPIVDPEARAQVIVPTIPDGTVLRILEQLVMLDGQRISYRSLDVEQIGSVYESMLAYTVARLDDDGICLRSSGRWVTASEVMTVPTARRARWLKEEGGLAAGVADRLARDLKTATTSADAMAVLRGVARKVESGQPNERAKLQFVIQPRQTADTSTAHYTPRSLSRPMVERLFEPIIRALGEKPSSAQLLSLKICDPAMGSGGFLVEACRYLAEHVLLAWQREGGSAQAEGAAQDPLMDARRVVAQRCLYGVDRNEDAVELGKLSLWLVTLARELPFTFVDHALRHGDSIVGLDLSEIEAFHWKKAEPNLVIGTEIRSALKEALELRMQIEELARIEGPRAQREKERLLWDAEDAIGRIRFIADLILAAYFHDGSAADRETLRLRYCEAVTEWLREDSPAPRELVEARDTFRRAVPAFHWMIELPEIFRVDRLDPLVSPSLPGRARMDAFAGNMPFIGGRRIATLHGERYAEWLCERYNCTGEVDYVTYFFLRANELLGAVGTIAFIATNTIAQGDTRRCGLRRLIADGLVVYDAYRGLEWPGEGAVVVSPVLLAKGSTAALFGARRLDGIEVPIINSRLRAFPERDDPATLTANAGRALVGCFLRGEGFVLDPNQAAEIVRAEPGAEAVVRPYLVGDDIAKDPAQRASRFVIDFGVMELDKARRYKRPMAVVEEHVRPERERLRSTGGDAPHRRYWWRFANPRVDLRKFLKSTSNCLVLPRVAKHLLVARVPTNQVFSEQVVILGPATMNDFAVLQSRVHETWVRLLSSTMGEGLRYSATDCFDTFPFPQAITPQSTSALAAAGEDLYEQRAKYMADNAVGLTVVYNRLKDPTCDEPRLVDLRGFHEELDRAVLAAYAASDPAAKWDDVEVPSFCLHDASDPKRIEKFEDDVIGRLFALNAQRAEMEKVGGLDANKKKTGKRTVASAKRLTGSNKAKEQLCLPKREDD